MDNQLVLPLQSAKVPHNCLICIPGAGAQVTSYLDFASFLPDHWNVYGLQHLGTDGCLPPSQDVKQAVESYMRELYPLIIGNAVHIVGHSFGGWIAFELAALLTKMSFSVKMLTILDSDPPCSACLYKNAGSIDVLEFWLEGLELYLERPVSIRRADLEMIPPEMRMICIHKCMVHEGLLPARSSWTELEGPLRVFETAIRMSYLPSEPFAGAVQLGIANDPRLSSVENALEYEKKASEWRLWVPNVKTFHARGNHITMLRGTNAKSIVETMLSFETV